MSEKAAWNGYQPPPRPSLLLRIASSAFFLLAGCCLIYAVREIGSLSEPLPPNVGRCGMEAIGSVIIAFGGMISFAIGAIARLFEE